MFSHHVESLLEVAIGGELLRVTEEHPFWVADQGWVGAGDLKPGDSLQTMDGGCRPMTGVWLVQTGIWVYNFSVDQPYYQEETMRKHAVYFLLALSCTFVAGLALWPSAARSVAPGRASLTEVWRRAQAAGAYHFSTDVVQTTTPRPTILNVGRESKRDELHLEGETDLPAKSLHLTLWSQGGSLLDPGSGVEMKVEGDRAYSRQGNQPWEETDDFTSLFAPGGDFMAYLAAATDVVYHEPASPSLSSSLSDISTSYTFRVDGRRYAAYMRDQLEQHMANKGELPPGVRLDLPQAYVGMTGRGQVWVGQDGLPVRQVVDLEFPDRPDDHYMTAHIVTDFGFRISDPSTPLRTSFGSASSQALNLQSPWLAGLGRLSPLSISHLPSSRSLSTLAIVTLSLALTALIIAYGRSKKLYALVSIGVIVSMLFSPLLQSQQVAAFAERQASRQKTQEAQAQENDTMRAALAAQSQPAIAPHADPIANAQWAGTATASNTQPALPEACTLRPNADDDQDDLLNNEECTLGTSPDMADTDGDGVNDKAEVSGFAWNGKTWYGDPLEADTNKDGLDDGGEWNLDANKDTLPDDTDGDSTPDLWDRDNDSDNVPDNLDLSPYTKSSSTFSAANPFEIKLDNLTPGLPVVVEFQLRPADSKRLQYAMNVLDWPKGDRQGQIQDDDGKTFFDLDNSTDRTLNDNGDVKLVPMLEIKVTGSPNNLPPQSRLSAYGVSVKQVTTNTQAVYVPLQLVVDNKGSARVAFYGRMPYHAAAAWGNVHQVRLVWTVQALMDMCKRRQDNVCVEYQAKNQLQTIYAYDDEWQLTGMTAREEQGTDLAIIYEDPAVDTNLQRDDALWLLLRGLDVSFLAGRDCDAMDANGQCVGNGQLDLTVAEIARRFNRTTNAGISAEQRWNIPNVLGVTSFSYPSTDQALMTTAVTETKAILGNKFSSAWAVANPISPTLMFARQERYRSLNLDESHAASPNVTWNGSRLTFNLAHSGEGAVPVQVMAGLSWAPFRYDSATKAWSSYPIEAYWSALERRLAADFAGEPDLALGAGQRLLAQILYVSINNSVANVVQTGDLVLARDYQTGDKPLGASMATATGGAIAYVAKLYFMSQPGAYAVVQSLGTGATQASLGLKPPLAARMFLNLANKWGRLGATLVVAGVAAGIVVAGYFLYQEGGLMGKVAVAVLVGAMVAYLSVYMPIKTAISVALKLKDLQKLSTGAAFAKTLTAHSELVNASAKAALIGMIISIGIAVGIFIYVWATGGVQAGSVAFNMLLAQTIASIIMAVLVFVLSLTVVGAILVAIVSIIDIVALIAGANWSISGYLTELIANTIFSFELTVNTDVQTGSLGMALVQAEKGFVAGNQIRFSLPATTTLTQNEPGNWWKARFWPYYWEHYNETKLRSTSFEYEMATRPVDETGLSTYRGKMSDQWQNDNGAYRAGDTPFTLVTLKAGVNRTMPVYLNTAYALPGVDCWQAWAGPYPVPICYGRTIGGASSSHIGANIILDVLPSSLDEFMQAGRWADGMVARDADGDGLLAKAYNGLDPDDTTWDYDGDGLSDAYELQMRARPADEGGQLLDPLNPDTDGDGLTDGEEIRLGANPANYDSDSDGIGDVQEVEGWLFTYAAGKTTRVFSDPLSPDADGDGLDDLAERSLHTCPGCAPLQNLYHPNVWNASPIALYTEMGDADGFVIPGQSLTYTLTAQNNLAQDIAARGELALSLPGALTGGPRNAHFDLLRGQSQSLVANLTVGTGSGSGGGASLAAQMNAQQHTPSVWAWDTPRPGPSANWKNVSIGLATGWQLPYLATGLEASGSVNRVVAYAATAEGLSGSGVYLDDGTLLNTAPDVACAANGACLVVWGGRNLASGQSGFYASQIGPNMANPTRLVMADFYGAAGTASVASDGTSFLVAWRFIDEAHGYNGIQAHLRANDGASQSSPGALVYNTGDPDVAWAGERYLVVWASGQGSSSPGKGAWSQDDIIGAYVSGNAAAPSTTFVQVTASSAQEISPKVAYDPSGRQTLVVYQHTLGGTTSVRGRILPGASSSEIILAAQVAAPLSLAVAPDPINGGWVANWSESNGRTSYQAVAADGSLRGTPQTVSGASGASDTGLGCAAPRPALRLALDENAGATTFADSSGYGRHVSCRSYNELAHYNSSSTCPMAGVGGKTGNALSLDGADDFLPVPINVSEDGYAASMWFKTTCQDCGLFQVDGNGWDRTIYLSRGNVCARVWSDEIICSSGINYADGNWHQVVHTFGSSVGGQYLYADGKQRAAGSKSASDFYWQTGATVGFSYDAASRYFNGALDDVVLYDRALSAGEAGATYNAALALYPFDEPPGAATFENAAHNGYAAACSGSQCPTAGVAGQAYAAARFDGSDDVVTVADSPHVVAEYNYNFESDAGVGWSKTTRDTTPAGATRPTSFLGQFGNEPVSLNLSNLPTHDQVEISFDLYILKSWDGNRTDGGPDDWWWSIDGSQVLRTTFSNHARDTGGSYQDYPDSPRTPSYGFTLCRDWEDGNCYNDCTQFTRNDPDTDNDAVGSDEASCYWYNRDAVAIMYEHDSFGGDAWLLDPARNIKHANYDWNDEITSIRVWAVANNPREGTYANNTLGYPANLGGDSVYRITRILDHTTNTIALSFGASGLEPVDNESWGLDNVTMKIKSRNVPLANASFSLAAWARRERSGASDIILGQGSGDVNRGLHFGFRDNNTFTCAFYANDLSTPLTYADNDWHHWACTYDALTRLRTVYRDGDWAASDVATANYQGYGTLRLGSGPGWANFGGTLDEVGVWPQALSAADVKTLYQKVKVLDDSVSECLLVQPGATSRLALRETTTHLGNTTQRVTDTLILDTDAPASTLTSLAAGQYLATTGTLIVGGQASDPTSTVGRVELSLDGGDWQPATGMASWAYTWNTSGLSDGPHTLRTRAVDAVGHVETPGAGMTVILDRTPPQVASATASGTILNARLDAQGRWVIPLNGSVADPAAGASPGSGTRLVEVLLAGQQDVAGQAWQPASLAPGAWRLDYVLPLFDNQADAMPRPTGRYTFRIRATDQAGNTTPETALLLQVDNSAPLASLASTGLSTATLTTTLTLHGVVTDTGAVSSGIAQLEASFVPAQQVDVVAGASLHLPLDEAAGAFVFDDASGQGHRAACGAYPPQAQFNFDEAAGALTFADASGQAMSAVCTIRYTPQLHLPFDEAVDATTFADASGHGHTGSCSGATCPTAGWTGKLGPALNLDGVDDYVSLATADQLSLQNSSFSVAAWIKGDAFGSGDRTILGMDSGEVNRQLHLVVRNGSPYMGFYANDTGSPVTLNAGQWYHLVWRYDKDRGEQAIFVDGALVASSMGHGPFQGNGAVHVGRWAGGYYFDGFIDDLRIYPQALSASEIQALYIGQLILCPTAGATGKHGSALGFDGADSRYVQLAHDERLNPGNELTLAAWVNLANPQADQKLLGKSNGVSGYVLGVVGNGLYPEIWDSAGGRYAFGQGNIPANAWTHLAVTWRSSGQMVGYINGQEVYRTPASANPVGANTRPLIVGASPWDVTAYKVNGLMDDVRAYNHALSAEQVWSLYGADLAPACPTAGAAGRVGQALHLDGMDDYIQTSGDLALANASFTAAFWAKRDTPDGGTLVLYQTGTSGANRALHIGFRDSNTFTCAFWANDLNATVSADTDWHHWACTYDAVTKQRKIYRDGLVVAQDTALADYQGSGPLWIGRSWGGYYGGWLDELRIYKRALLPDEVSALYQAGSQAWAPVTLAASGSGVAVASWTYTVPTGLEGIYQLNLRGTDVLGNRTPLSGAQRLWRGGIDTRPPRLNLISAPSGSGSAAITSFQCQAQDFNLYLRMRPNDPIPAGYDFKCPCPPSTYELTTYDQVSAWYQRWFTDATHLYQVQATCSLPGRLPGVTMRACDVYGHCTTWPASSTQALDTRSPQAPTAAPEAAVLSPADGDVLTTSDPISITVGVYALDALKALTLTVNSAVIDTHTWSSNTVSDALYAFNWTPPGEGRYSLDALARDWAGNAQTTTYPVSITVDTQAPTVILTPTVLTTTHQHALGQVILAGTAADTVGVSALQVQGDGGAWQAASVEAGPTPSTVTWRSPWYLGEQVEGATYTVTAQALDPAGHTALVTESVWVDLVPPTHVTLTLSGSGSSFQPGVPVSLTWTASSDGSGLGDYLVEWTVYSGQGTTTTRTAYDPAGPLTAAFPAGEAQQISIRFASQDIYGNQAWQSLEPIYFDTPFTPDYAPLALPGRGDGGEGEGETPYIGWMDSGCSLLGVDRRVKRMTTGRATLDAEQRLYATWNTATLSPALRLAWTGADWDYDGNLFVYFDTDETSSAPGGASQLYNPYTDTTGNIAIYLPGNEPEALNRGGRVSNQSSHEASNFPDPRQVYARASLGYAFNNARTPQASAQDSAMRADYMVQIEDSATATLWRWDGTTWVTQTVLSEAHYQLDTNAAPAVTDLLLPTAWLGITNPVSTTLSLVAVATEEDSLHVWATQPERNSVNSARVVNPIAAVVTDQVFAMTRAFHWDSLGTGVCPNGSLPASSARHQTSNAIRQASHVNAGSAFADTDLQVQLTLTPIGRVYRLMADDLAWLWNVLFGSSSTVNNSASFDFMDIDHPPLGHGQVVTYTFQYANRGTQPATGLALYLMAWYSLDLPGQGDELSGGYGEGKTISLTDVLPGTVGTYVFTGTVDVLATGQAHHDLCRQSYPYDVCQPQLGWASLDVFLYDRNNPTQPPLEWIWVDQQVDSRPPDFVGIQSPQAAVRPGLNSVRGYAYDESQVPTITLQTRPISGSTTTLPACVDDTPDDGQWACEWDTGSAVNGDWLELSVQATDHFGHASAWTPWRTVMVDSRSPTLSVDAEALAAVDGQLLGPGTHDLTGQIYDNASLGQVQICRPGEAGRVCELATLWSAGSGLTGTASIYDDVPAQPLPITTTTVCGGEEITRTFDVTDTFIVGDVNVGVNADHTYRDEVVVDLISPAATRVRLILGEGDLLKIFRNYDVLLDDSASQSLYTAADDDTAEPYFNRLARPYQPLAAFNGENAAGEWKLIICDLIPDGENGAYNRSRLILSPQASAQPTTANWRYSLPQPQDTDGGQVQLSLYGADSVGNGTTAPISLSYRVDVVAPILTVTRVLTELSPLGMLSVLGGQVSDGSTRFTSAVNSTIKVNVRVDSPDGISYNGRAEQDESGWRFTPLLNASGAYTLWVEARDAVGNTAPAGPYPLQVDPIWRVYLPLAARNFSSLPDLVGSFSISPTTAITSGAPVSITVVVTNQGNGPADDFWVTLYINPSEPPTAANQPWSERCTLTPCYGIEWQMGAGLQPGQSLTAYSNPSNYDPAYSNWASSFFTGTSDLYLYVDSMGGYGSPAGIVIELDESNNRAESHVGMLQRARLFRGRIESEGRRGRPYLRGPR